MKRIIKCLALAIVCLQMTVCFGCSNSDKSEKKSSSSKSKSSGFDSPDEAIEAYLNAFIEQDSKALYEMVYKDEWDIFHDYFNDDLSKKDITNALDQYMQEEIAEELSDHPIDEWKQVNHGYEDITDEFLIGFTSGTIDFDEVRKQYDKMGLQKVIRYDWVVLEHEESNDFIDCITDDVILLKINGEWYLSFWFMETL